MQQRYTNNAGTRFIIGVYREKGRYIPTIAYLCENGMTVPLDDLPGERSEGAALVAIVRTCEALDA